MLSGGKLAAASRGVVLLGRREGVVVGIRIDAQEVIFGSRLLAQVASRAGFLRTKTASGAVDRGKRSARASRVIHCIAVAGMAARASGEHDWVAVCVDRGARDVSCVDWGVSAGKPSISRHGAMDIVATRAATGYAVGCGGITSRGALICAAPLAKWVLNWPRTGMPMPCRRLW